MARSLTNLFWVIMDIISGNREKNCICHLEHLEKDEMFMEFNKDLILLQMKNWFKILVECQLAQIWFKSSVWFEFPNNNVKLSWSKQVILIRVAQRRERKLFSTYPKAYQIAQFRGYISFYFEGHPWECVVGANGIWLTETIRLTSGQKSKLLMPWPF